MDELFNNSSDSSVEGEDNTKIDNALEALVGEGKKFASVDLLAKGKLEADNFISRLEKENRELRKELNTRLTAEQILEKLDKNSRNPQGEEQGPPGNTPGSDNPNGKALTEEQIASLVQKHLQMHGEKTREQANTAIVVQELKKSLGNNYTAQIETRLNDLGISKEIAIRMAATMPKAFLELVNKPNTSKASSTFVSPPRSSQRETSQGNSYSPNFEGSRNKAYYDKMRTSQDKALQKLYWTPRIQNEMHEQAKALGDAFYS